MTWNELVKIEPRLLILAKKALAYKKNSRGKEFVCANDRWYGHGQWKGRGIKAELLLLIGWLAENPTLKTTEAYDVGYRHIYNLLPECQNCGCIAIQKYLEE